MVEAAQLAGRMARCQCGAERPSDLSLPFFEYRGPGSHEASVACKHCSYHLEAHLRDERRVDPSTVVERGKCPGFEARGPFEHDRFYCGCRGWD